MAVQFLKYQNLESFKTDKRSFLWKECRQTANSIFFFAYVVCAHWYDVLCAYVSIKFNYLTAFMLTAILLFVISALIVCGHTWAEKKFGWDITGLDEFKSSKSPLSIPKWRIIKRLKHFAMNTRKTTFWLGSIIVGPPVITILLRKDAGWGQNLKYIIPGTLLSAGFWVSFYVGIGLLVWQQFIKPFFQHLNLTILWG